MKNQLKSLLLVAVFALTTLPAWSQASTEGKDFWVANTIICQPPTASSAAYPTIAVSAQKACTVTISDYLGNQLVTANVTAGSWTRFGDKNASVDPAEYALAPAKWYPTTDNVNATDVYKHADKINNYGLHITATENISVFVIMRTPQYSMDASNALPITALQSEYYLQDFYPDANGVDKPVTMTTILATENNTKVDITPKGNTYGKTNSGTKFTVTLNQGQTYYLISEVNSQLAGTHIVAQDDKKIAVYVGSPVTRLPGGVAARDGLFEQMMPTVYLGTQFIATRSLQKDGNIIGITATQNGTEIKVDGYTQTYISEGETYYILLQGPADPYSKNLSKLTCSVDQVITADAAYIETSCPCAVIGYDTGNSFAGATGSEIVNGQGDPSSVWISPIQQKINRITFGACYTTKTKAHFLNVVTETATCANTKLTAYMGQNGADWSNKLTWTAVPGNPAYSYARVQIGNDQPSINVFTLENSKGFIAHVYGNGEDESYAYSAGSAAVEQGVSVNGETFINGYRSDSKFCMDSLITFDASVGTDEITRVDWNFGDGISKMNGSSKEMHEYTSPGWYDVTADLYGHQVCTEESEQFLGSVQFSFRVVQPVLYFDTVEHKCLSLEEQAADPARCAQLVAEGYNDTIWPDADHCWEDIPIIRYDYGLITEQFDTIKAQDLYYESYNGVTYPINPENPEDYKIDVVFNLTELLGIKNSTDCDIILHRHIEIVTCLDMSIPNDPNAQHACYGDRLDIPYIYRKGDIGKATVSINGKTEEVSLDYGVVTLPVSQLKPGAYQATVYVEDTVCNQVLKFPLDFAIYYPADIFLYKFNNVLAVYKPGFGGNKDGFVFTGYQWYRNGVAIEGANESVYHVDGTFEKGDEVYVVLTNKEGESIPSCPQTIPNVPDFNPQPNAAPAEKLMLNSRIVIRKGETLYDIYGQRVE